jgi:hypothetical protein
VGDPVILAGLVCQGHEFKNLRLRKDILPLLIGEVELLQLCECPHHAVEDIMDTFLAPRMPMA